MRWIFLTLLLLNLLVFGLQWANMDPAPGMPVQAPPSANVEPLVLLSEATPAQLARAPAARAEAAKPATSAKPAPAAKPGEEPLCLVVGPVEAETSAQQILAAFRAAQIPARMTSKDVAHAPDYWVYLPPLPNRDAAIRRLREIQQDMRIDSFLISQGPLVNGISLGLFKNIEKAQELQRERIQQGLDARLTEVERKIKEFSVLVGGENGLDSIAKATEIMEEKGLPGERRQIFCKSVATARDIP